MQDYGELERTVRSRTVKRVRESLFANKVPEKDHLRYVLDIEQRLVTLDDVRMFVASDGAILTLTLSLVRSGIERTEADKIASSIPIWDAVKLALEVSTFNAMFREKMEAAREEDERIRAAEREVDHVEPGT